MTSNFLTGFVLLAIGLEDRLVRAAEYPTASNIESVVELNAKTKTVGDKEYHLLAIRFDWRICGQINDSTAVFWLFNGKSLERASLPLTKDELPTGTPPAPPVGILVAWVQFPDKGKLEILCGPLQLSRPVDDAELRRRFMASGIRPYSVSPDVIPMVTVERAEDLSKAIDKASQPRQMPKASPRIRRDRAKACRSYCNSLNLWPDSLGKGGD